MISGDEISPNSTEGFESPSCSVQLQALVAQMVKSHLQYGRPGLYPWNQEDSLGKMATTQYSALEIHGQKGLAGYSPLYEIQKVEHG